MPPSTPESKFPWWHHPVTTLDELVRLVREHSVFVAFDTEFPPLYSEMKRPQAEPCVEAGWAIAPTMHIQEAEVTRPIPMSTDALVSKYSIRAQVTRIRSRHRRRGRRIQEPLRYGAVDWTDVEGMDEYIDHRLEDLIREAGVEGRSLVLVGYSLECGDLRLLRDEFPKAGRHFSAWADLHTLISKATPPKVPIISLGDALEALGYDIRDAGNMHSKNHCAGRDAIRTLALLEALPYMDDTMARKLRLNHREACPTLLVYDRLRKAPSQIHWVPRTAVMNMQDSNGFPESIDSIFNLSCFIDDRGHRPTSIIGGGWVKRSQVGPTRKKARELLQGGRTWAHIVFRDEFSMQWFVQDMNRTVVDGVGLKATSFVDSGHDLGFIREIEEEGLRKRERRRQLKENPDVLCNSLGPNFDGLLR